MAKTAVAERTAATIRLTAYPAVYDAAPAVPVANLSGWQLIENQANPVVG